MYTLTKLYYVGHTLSMSLTTMRQFEDTIWGFLWRGSSPLARREVCISFSSCRGVRMPHLQSRLTAIHLKTISRLFDDDNHAAWKQLAMKELHNFSGQYQMKLALFAAIDWKPPSQNIAQLLPYYRNHHKLMTKHVRRHCGEIKDEHEKPLFYPSIHPTFGIFDSQEYIYTSTSSSLHSSLSTVP